ncbi:unnamed protein product [Oncorhynchus mykiss]|uniref:Uncharacterized protein n=1 Tax=Oncorhynchus mykiss TaxID=8022 RepID=A0A060XP59_ONCMY|nr:unnamed protein product [Oncorhynchus mykiss]
MWRSVRRALLQTDKNILQLTITALGLYRVHHLKTNSIQCELFESTFFLTRSVRGEKKKYEPPILTRVGKRAKKSKGPNAASKLLLVTPHTHCRLKLLKQEMIKDYLLMEEFIRNQE